MITTISTVGQQQIPTRKHGKNLQRVKSNPICPTGRHLVVQKTTNSYKFNYKHHQTGPPPPCSSVKLGFLVHVVPLHPSTSKNIAESSRTHRMNTLCKPTDRNDSKRTKPYSFDSDLNFRLEPVIQLGSNWFCCAPAPSIPSADKKAWETRSQVVQPHFRRTIERSHTLQIDGRICYIMDIMLQFVFSILA